MAKHRLRESIKSLFGSHIDPEKDDQLKGAKLEIDSKVEKILKLIKAEDLNETPVGNSKKEPLIELIEDFHKQYHSLYARYDHLTGELRKEVHIKQEKESSSSSSSSESESEYSSKRKGSKNGRVDTEYQKVSDGIKRELETANLEIADLKRKLTATAEEKQDLESKLQVAETIIRDLKIGAERFEGEKSKLLVDYDELIQKLNTASNELNQKLEAKTTENDNLIMEKEAAMRRIEEGEKVMEDLRATADQLIDERESLKLELEAVNQQVESARQEVKDLSHTQKTTQEEKNSLILRISEISDEIKQAQNVIQELMAETSQLKENLNGRDRELSNLVVMHELHENEALDRIKVLETQVTDLELELNTLNGQKREMEAQIENKATEAKQLEDENLRLQAWVSELEITSKEKEDEIATLLKKLEDNENISRSKMEFLAEKVNNLHLEVDNLRIQNGELEEQKVLKSNEAAAQVKDLMDRINVMQQELASLHSQRSESELHVENKTREISEHLVKIEFFEQELASNTADRHRLLEEKEGFTTQLKGLELEVDSLSKQKSELQEQLRSKDCEFDQLREEKEGMQANISELEKTLTARKDELSTLQKKYEDQESEASANIMALTAHVNSLQAEVDSLQGQKGEMEELLACNSNEASDQIKGLMDQVNAMQQELESLQSHKSRSESELTRKNEEISDICITIKILEEEIASKMGDHQRVLEHKEGLVVQVKDLEMEVESLHNQKNELEEQIRSINQDTNQLRVEKEGMQCKILELEKTLTEGRDELSALQKKHEHEGNEAVARIMALTEQVNNLQHDLDSLLTQKNELELQIERQKQEYSESLVQAENQSMELSSKIEDQQSTLKEQEDAFNKLNEEYKQVQTWFQECKQNLQVAERKIEGMAEDFHNNIGSKDLVVADLERMIDELKGDLEVKAEELGTLVEFIRTIEVKLRLSNQKLRVTEQLLTEKEESHKNTEGEYRVLEEKIATLSGIIASNKKAHLSIITAISEKVNTTMTGLESVVRKFQEEYGNYETCLSEMTEELRTAKDWVEATNHEKEQLKKEVCNLVEQLKEKEEHESMLREKVGKLEVKANKEEEEREKLAKAVSRLEQKIGKYEEVVKEKDEGMLGLGEEKREAIRQLCLWIDYHRSRYDYLKEQVLSKIPTVRTQRAN